MRGAARGVHVLTPGGGHVHVVEVLDYLVGVDLWLLAWGVERGEVWWGDEGLIYMACERHLD